MRKRYVCGPSKLILDGFNGPIRPGEPFEYDFGAMEAVHFTSGAIRLHANQDGVVQPVVHVEPTIDPPAEAGSSAAPEPPVNDTPPAPRSRRAAK